MRGRSHHCQLASRTQSKEQVALATSGSTMESAPNSIALAAQRVGDSQLRAAPGQVDGPTGNGKQAELIGKAVAVPAELP